jgi:hypothetical protein
LIAPLAGLFILDRKLHYCSQCGAEKVDCWGKGKAWFAPVAKKPRYGLGLTPTEDKPIVKTERCDSCGAVQSEKRMTLEEADT